ncbi:arachidonate 5-lipoxygenase-activating protein isoform X2 [Canis lupus dingo]|uniref:arachidonate 5-lipoxygenase-activating protein isoform X2 n=1 Tax=Canis lupus dingo TaxID=286419 RepID=UPI0020C2C112|nr:arachidonate 5-lipoxygenase-activating protein isoform X2 [Canis lupus dingo]
MMKDRVWALTSPFCSVQAWVPPNWSSPYWGARSKHGSRSRGEYCPVGHHHPHQRGPERQNCVDAYPTFLVVLWSAGLLCSQVPAAFAGLMYLFVRQKYFVGYLGERTQRDTQKEETQAEGEAGSLRGARFGTQSQNPGIMT